MGYLLCSIANISRIYHHALHIPSPVSDIGHESQGTLVTVGKEF